MSSASAKDIAENIKVFVRERPHLSTEPIDTANPQEQSGIKAISEDFKTCKYFSSSSNVNHTFKLDKIFAGVSEQKQLYDTIAAPIVSSALQGYSGTIFAYGPTSSGKTFTMRGGEGDTEGIIPRCLKDLFSKSDQQKTEIWISYLQIYCEQITDLLSSGDTTGDSHHLTIRERGGNVFVEGLNRYRITSVEEFWSIFLPGDANRNTASTNKNETSSRSHAALMVHIILKEGSATATSGSGSGGDACRESVLVLVDLAGSERYAASTGRDLMRLEEAKSINLSLSALGNCMSAMAEERSHIPYRDSKLTRLLQGSLGGASRTAVIVNVAPGPDDTGEVLNALRFASRASKIKVMAKIGRYIDYESMYKDTRKKLEQLQQQGGGTGIEVVKKKEEEWTELLRKKETLLEQKNIEIEQLKESLRLLRATTAPVGATSVCTAANSNAADASTILPPTTTNVDEVNAFWEKKLKEVTAEHLSVIETANKTNLARLQRSRATIDELNYAISSLQDDLNFERQKHLSTVQELRLAHEKRSASENELKERIDELLVELADRRSSIDDLVDALNETKTRAESAEEEAEAKYRNYVSREQVKEMENLFVETVTKLSARVQSLEGSRSNGGTPSGGNQMSNGRDGFVNTNSSSGGGGGSARSGGRTIQQVSGRGGNSSATGVSFATGSKQPHQPFQPRYMQTVSVPNTGSSSSSSGKSGARIEPGGKIRPSLWNTSTQDQPSLAAVGERATLVNSPRSSPAKPPASGGRGSVSADIELNVPTGTVSSSSGISAKSPMNDEI